MSEEPANAVARLTFVEFCARLPSARPLPVAMPPPPELDPLEERPFIEPTLTPILEEQSPAVILIAARGAVGKTTLSREIARRTGTNLWRLGQVQVGHRYLEGALAAAYGDGQFSVVTDELRHGKRAIVLDGLDEALLRAGESNFDAFLESLAARFQAAAARPSLVLLGRTLAAERAYDRLSAKGVRVSYYEIDYFDRQAAERFLEIYLERGQYRPHRVNRAEFERARDAVLSRLGEAVPGGLDPSSVVGYAPVLRLVAELLDVGNPHAIAQEARTWRSDELLRKVAEGILAREQEQKVHQVPEYRTAQAWAPEEQCLRLLARRAGHALQARLPERLPDHLREEYERRVGVWINEHPFVREPVFEEYVLAWLLTRRGIGEALLAEDLRDHLRAETPSYRPTPLLVRFSSDIGGGHVSVAAADFGFVYESALADSASSPRKGSGHIPRLNLNSSNARDDIVGEIVFPTAEKQSKRRVSLLLTDSRRGVWFWRQLASANLSVAADVRIGAGSDFVLGPDVDLECAAFCCEAGVVRIVAPTVSEQVVIEAESYGGKAAPEVASFDPRPHLKVAWKPLGYPWSRYPLASEHAVTAETKEAFVRLRRILKPFRATVHFDDLACAAELIDRAAGADLAGDILEFCQKKKLLSRTSDSYLLDRAVLDDLGIHWEDLAGRKVSPKIASFLNEFSRWRAK